MKSQLKLLLENPIIQDSITRFRLTCENSSPSEICDITDGAVYQELLKDKNCPLGLPNNFSYVFNTDGAQVFNSSAYSVWPLFIMLNELHPKDRFKHTEMVGLWFGKTPNMNMFLEQFVTEGNDLADNGLEWKNKNGDIS